MQRRTAVLKTAFHKFSISFVPADVFLRRVVEENILKLEQLAVHMIHCGRTSSRELIFRALLNLQPCHRPPDYVTTTPSLPFNSEAFTGSQIPLNFFHTWGSFYVKCDYITISNLASSLSRLYVHHIERLDTWCIFFNIFYCSFY